MKELPYNTLHHFGYVSPPGRNKHNIQVFPNHDRNTKNVDFLTNSKISKVEITALPDSIQQNINQFKDLNLIYNETSADKVSVCLNMIVKNESKNLLKYLPLLSNYIDEYLIIDTGSTDDTKETIQKLFDGIPGRILDHPFDDYSSCRNEGLNSIKSE